MPVQDHYGSADIVERVLAAIPWSRDGGARLEADQLFPFDQLHGRELRATEEHAARLDPAEGSRILDIGSGIGGPARYVARTFRCHVNGIDLTPSFVTAATELTDQCGMAGQVSFHLGDAAALPFEAASFDGAYCFYVGMNLPDKPAVLTESLRVLKPRGTLIWTEVTLAAGDPHYPLPWSRSADGSHLDGSEILLGRFRDAGFEVISVEDETDAHLELARRTKQAGVAPRSEHRMANEIVLGADFLRRRQNYIESLSQGRIASTVIVARKPNA